jgi:predicted  nucleic acid-binding Zn-ribbon protein
MSKCKNGKLGFHEWKTLEDNPKELIEVCTNCGEKKWYKKEEKQRINNKEYHDAHEKDFIQPKDPRFNLIYNSK